MRGMTDTTADYKTRRAFDMQKEVETQGDWEWPSRKEKKEEKDNEMKKMPGRWNNNNWYRNKNLKTFPTEIDLIEYHIIQCSIIIW